MTDREQEELRSLYQQADEALSAGDYERVCELLGERTEGGEPDPEACALVGLAHFYGGDYEDARELLEVAVRESPEDHEARAGLGACCFFALEVAEAERHLRRVVEAEPEWAEGHYWLARLLDWRSRSDPAIHGEAEKQFQRAARLDPEGFPLPLELTDQEFDDVLQDAIRRLPPRIAKAVEEVTIVVDSYPDEAFLEEHGDGLSPDLLGLYTGTALPHRHHLDSGRLPDVIHVFKRNLELTCADREELIGEIRDTLLHEVGHYLGLEEDELGELGL